MMMNHMYCMTGGRLQHRIISHMQSASDFFEDYQEALKNGDHVRSEIYHRSYFLELDKVWGLMEIMDLNKDEYDMVSEHIVDIIEKRRK